MRRTIPAIPATALALVLLLAGEAPACPNCKEAVAAQPSDVAATAQGYSWSIMLMMSMPFTLLGTGAFFVARAVKRGTIPEM